jgi:hypothetical protein
MGGNANLLIVVTTGEMRKGWKALLQCTQFHAMAVQVVWKIEWKCQISALALALSSFRVGVEACAF